MAPEVKLAISTPFPPNLHCCDGKGLDENFTPCVMWVPRWLMDGSLPPGAMHLFLLTVPQNCIMHSQRGGAIVKGMKKVGGPHCHIDWIFRGRELVHGSWVSHDHADGSPCHKFQVVYSCWNFIFWFWVWQPYLALLWIFLGIGFTNIHHHLKTTCVFEITLNRVVNYCFHTYELVPMVRMKDYI